MALAPAEVCPEAGTLVHSGAVLGCGVAQLRYRWWVGGKFFDTERQLLTEADAR